MVQSRLILATLLSIAATAAWAGPGFGTIRKKFIELKTRQPAAVRLANTSIALTGSSTNREYTPVQESLLATLETELVSNERTLVKKETPKEADWTLTLKVTGYSIANPQQRTETTGKTSNTYTRWNGSLNVAYQVVDHSGRVHAANNFSSLYNQEFNTGGSGGLSLRLPNKFPAIGKKPGPAQAVPHSTEDLKQIMIKDVVGQIAGDLGNTTKSLPVEVAVGDEHLNRASDFMDKQLWVRAVDELEKTPAFARPDDEAYRQYDLGLAFEAMSYDSKNATEQRENIFKAAEYYDKALETNTKEKYFVESVARTKDALARFKALDLQQTSKLKGTGPKDTMKEASSAPSIKTADVIEMFSSGVPEDQIIDIIRNSPVVFNPRDKETAMAIAKAKLPITLQNEMRKKSGALLLDTASPK